METLLANHFKNNYSNLLGLITYRTGSRWDAEDILQIAYYRALRYKKAFNPEKRLDDWFFFILENALKAYRNAEKQQKEIEFFDDGREISDTLYSQQLLKVMIKEIDAKNEVHKEVLTLHFLEDWSIKQIPEVLDVSFWNAHQIVKRFKNEIKEKYGEID